MTYEFGDFQLNCKNQQLLHNGISIAMTPKAFSVLTELVKAQGELVTKEALMETVWTDVIVSDAALTVCIREIRKALGDSARSPLFIATVHKRGYRFIGEIKESSKQSSTKFFRNNSTNDLVERHCEYEQLSHALSHARNGKSQIVFISGEAGLGKTTLVEQFAKHKCLDDVRFTRGQCTQLYGHVEPYLPWLDAFTHLCQQDKKLLHKFNHYAPTWLLQMPSLLEKQAHEELEHRLAGTNPQRMLREVLEFLNAVSKNRPLVIYLEDMHFSDIASVELLSAIAHRRGYAQLMIIACARPAELAAENHPLNRLKQELEVRKYSTNLDLEPFTTKQVYDFINIQLTENSFPPAFADAIGIRTDGNPLFIINVVEYLQKENLIKLVNNVWTLNCTLETVQTCLPDNLMQMLGYHIEHLHMDIQIILQAAAVACNAGTGDFQFSTQHVAAAIDKDNFWVEDQCEQLSRSQHFIQSKPGEDFNDDKFQSVFVFTHGLYQEAFYQCLTNARRASLHLKIAQYLESVHPTHNSEIEAKLAVHFERGRDPIKAAEFLVKSAETASRRGVNSEAGKSLDHALTLCRRLPNGHDRQQIELAIYISKGPILIAEKGNTDQKVEDNYLNAQRLCKQAGDAQQMFPIVFGLRSYNLLSGHLNKAHDLSHDLLRLAKEDNNADLLLEAYVALASTAFFLGDFEQSLTHALQGISQYHQDRHAFHVKHYGLDPGVFCYCRAAQVLWSLGYPDQALSKVKQSIALAEQLEHPYSLAFAHNNHAWVNMYRREPDECVRHARRAVTLATEYGFPFYKVWGQIMQGWGLTHCQNPAQGIAISHQSIAESAPMASAIRSYLLTVMADIYLSTGEYNKGLAVLDEIKTNSELFLEAERLNLRGKLLLMKALKSSSKLIADFDNAKNWINKSIELAQNQQARSFELRARTSLAQLLSNQGHKVKARAALVTIVNSFDEGQHTADVVDAQRLLQACDKDKVIRIKDIKHNVPKKTA